MGYGDIYEGDEARVVLPLKDYIAMFNSTVLVHGINYNRSYSSSVELGRQASEQTQGITGASSFTLELVPSERPSKGDNEADFFVTLALERASRCRILSAAVQSSQGAKPSQLVYLSANADQFTDRLQLKVPMSNFKADDAYRTPKSKWPVQSISSSSQFDPFELLIDDATRIVIFAEVDQEDVQYSFHWSDSRSLQLS